MNIALFAGGAQAQAGFPVFFPSPKNGQLPFAWDMSPHLAAPAIYPVEDPALSASDGIRPLFFESVTLNGKSTRVFAWLGIPAVNADSRQKIPGIVLVHGGGGTAYRDWVKLWNARGYAAIAMDTCGAMPSSAEGMRLKSHRHSHSGAPFAGGGFSQALAPVENQWPYHAVAAIIRAHSLLLANQSVDSTRTGITGVSWGGILTEIAACLDSRFKFAAPVYGCGYLGENSFWLENDFPKIVPASLHRWISLWDPSQYLGLPASATPAARTPFLFVNGTNDKHFRPDSWDKTLRLASSNGRQVTRVFKIRMQHDHPPTGDPPEILRFADAILRQGPPLPRITLQTTGSIRWENSASVPVAKAELVYTLDTGSWSLRHWRTSPAAINATNDGATADIPPAATAWYLNIHDTRGHIVSGELHQMGEKNP